MSYIGHPLKQITPSLLLTHYHLDIFPASAGSPSTSPLGLDLIHVRALLLSKCRITVFLAVATPPHLHPCINLILGPPCCSILPQLHIKMLLKYQSCHLHTITPHVCYMNRNLEAHTFSIIMTKYFSHCFC